MSTAPNYPAILNSDELSLDCLVTALDDLLRDGLTLVAISVDQGLQRRIVEVAANWYVQETRLARIVPPT